MGGIRASWQGGGRPGRAVTRQAKAGKSDNAYASYFFLFPEPVAVILVVDMRSPMYFWRNLLFESSLSCSSLTASMRLKISRRDSWRSFACLN